MTESIYIGNRRELFVDDHLIIKEKTTAKLKMHKPEPKEIVINHNEPWEGDGCVYHCIIKDDTLYRMYYSAWEMMDKEITALRPNPQKICYAESNDGKIWVKPKLGIQEYNGSKENNILLDDKDGILDSFFVFKDTNPDCPKNEIYKGITYIGNHYIGDQYLWCFTSEDGINFKKAWPMTNCGRFDTLNIGYWDKHKNQYFCYIRDLHNIPTGEDLNKGIRDIRWMVSKDFKTWSAPILLDFGEGDDYPLYTNVIQPYYRADHILFGFPSRYVEKSQWTSNFEQLSGAEMRKKRMKLHPRYGLAITDCVFMSSRNGINWRRWDEAFMTPGIEHLYNWVYGDCYPALGMIETKSEDPYVTNEISMYAKERHFSMMPAELRRYTIRIDGFVSFNSTYRPCKIVTKPFIFDGNKLSVNFATSAIGYIKIKLTGEGKELNSMEIFGDNIDRTVVFEDGEIESLAGKPVTMEITMSDADIYSFKFST